MDSNSPIDIFNKHKLTFALLKKSIQPSTINILADTLANLAFNFNENCWVSDVPNRILALVHNDALASLPPV